MAAVERTLAAMRSSDRVVRLGYVPDEAVPPLLRGAIASVYPAIEEGFGLPALEALACGTPLVTTAGTAMAELTDGAAALVAPGDVAELADAMIEAVDGGSVVADRSQRGLVIASEHTWAASATGHLAVYRWAASHRSPARPGRRGGS
jgi:glycosyltransferase involved in cell wall biosynthesis